MSTSQRIYLDNAATSWPKPEAVYAAVDQYQRQLGAPAGRSGYAEAAQVSQAVEAARREVARLLGARDANRLVFSAGGTDSLNLAIHGLLRPGDHAITTVIEHNSVLRPLRHLESAGKITVTRVGCGADGVVDPGDVRRALAPNTRLIAVSHASNVTGAMQPVAEIGLIARVGGAFLLVDAAQTAGHVPIGVEKLNADLLATSGHKGLLGPLGTGVLYLRPGMEAHLDSLRQGGTGTLSEDDRQPDILPSKYEAGSLNVPGIVGLRAAAEYLSQRGLEAVRKHSQSLTERLLGGLAELPRVRVYGPRQPERNAGLVSVTLEGYDPHEVAATLDGAYRIQVRAGIHCAPRMHRALATLETGGTVRFSVGVFNTTADIDAAVAALGEIASAPLRI